MRTSSRTRRILWYAAAAVAVGCGASFVLRGFADGAHARFQEALDALSARGVPLRVRDLPHDDRRIDPDHAAAAQAWEETSEGRNDFGNGISEADIDSLMGDTQAIAAVRAYLACRSRVSFSDPEGQDGPWMALLEACSDPRRVSSFGECDLAAIRALRAIREPILPAATRLLRSDWDGGREDALRWSPSSVDPPSLRERGATATACSAVLDTLPGVRADGEFELLAARLADLEHGIAQSAGCTSSLAFQFWNWSASLGLRACELVLAGRPEPTTTRAVAALADHLQPLREYEHALAGERTMTIERIREIVENARRGRTWWPWADYEVTREATAYLREFDDAFERALHGGSALVLPPLEGRAGSHLVWRKAREQETRRLLVKLACIVREHGIAEAERTAAEWRDPISNRPFRLRAEPDHVIIWSAGWNLFDDDGRDHEVSVTFGQGIFQTTTADMVVRVVP